MLAKTILVITRLGQGCLVCCSPWGCKRIGHKCVAEQQQITEFRIWEI